MLLFRVVTQTCGISMIKNIPFLQNYNRKSAHWGLKRITEIVMCERKNTFSKVPKSTQYTPLHPGMLMSKHDD